MRMYFVEPGVAVYARPNLLSKKAFNVPETGWFVDVIERRREMTYLHFGSSSGWIWGSPLTPLTFRPIMHKYDAKRYDAWHSEDGVKTILEDYQALHMGYVLKRGDYVINKVTDMGFWSEDDRYFSPVAYSAFAQRNPVRNSLWIGA